MKPEHETGGGLEQETPAVQLGGSLIPTYGTHRVKNPGLEDIERTAISHVSNNFRGDLQPGKVAMPRGPRGEKRPAGSASEIQTEKKQNSPP